MNRCTTCRRRNGTAYSIRTCAASTTRIRVFAPVMIRAYSGHIINVSSLAGKNALPKGAAYAASKWGLNGLSYSVAEELRPHNVRVSVICPGSVDTELGPHTGKD